MDFKNRYRNEVMKKKREEKANIKREFVDSGQADAMMARVKAAGRATIKPEDLPF